MSKLSYLACVMMVSSLAAGCGGSDEGDDADGAANSTASTTGGSNTTGSSNGSSTTTGGSTATSTSATSAGGASSTSASTTTSANTVSTTGGSANVPGNTPLTEIDTDAEAQAVCDQLAAEFGSIDTEAVTEGLCALTGLIGELSGGGDCETLQAQCIADGGEEPAMTEGCTADDVPDCDITVDEYTACTSARVAVSFDTFAEVTCDSDLESLGEEPADPAECAGLGERCPELATEG